VDVGKALSISTGKAKNPLSIKIKRVLEKLDLNGFLFASA
jgi:hypothetical protein